MGGMNSSWYALLTRTACDGSEHEAELIVVHSS